MEGNKTVDEVIWQKARNGEISSEELWKMYVGNLRRALKSVKELIKQTDYENIVITADHGEALGELGVYGHPKNLDHPKIRKIPWQENQN